MKIPSYLHFSSKPSLPVILQAESAECGLACLAMIASYFGHDVDLNALRQRFQFSSSGANIRHLMDVANSLSLSSRALRLELDTLSRLKLPAILHWSGNHFVVLESISGSSVVIHDPARGRRNIKHSELSASFTGVALEFTKVSDFQMVRARIPVHMRDLWNRIHGLKFAITQVLLLSIIFQIVTFSLPLQLQLVIDESLAHSDSEILFVIAVGFLGLFAFQAIVQATRDWVMQLFGQQFILQIIGNLTRHLLKLPSSYFEKRHLGDIMSRMQSIRVIQDIVLRGVIGALIDGIMACVALALLFFYSTELAAIVVIAFSVIGIANYAFYSLIRQKTEVQLAAAAKEQTFLMETIRAVTAIKLLGKEIERESTWKNMFIRSTNMSMEVSRIQIKLNVIQNIIEGAQYTAIVYFSAKMIIEAKGFSVGMMMAFLSYRQTFVNGANAFIYQFNQMRLVRLHVERLGDIITQEPEEISDCSISPRIDGDVRFKNVSFRYGATDTNVLLDINMHIKRGEFVAIVGASGCGKSTLLKLLVGLYIPTSGEIEIDGTLASAEKWRAWRKSIGIVGQDDRLFSGSISENIAVFDANIDMERVIESAKSAQIHDEILLKPMQYQTLIGDMGAALSGGQKQRILLARSIYRNPRLLILDEGTANLDRNSETLIADYVSSLNITRIVVAHRPALVERADRVFNLANGKILEVSKSDIVQSIP